MAPVQKSSQGSNAGNCWRPPNIPRNSFKHRALFAGRLAEETVASAPGRSHQPCESWGTASHQAEQRAKQAARVIAKLLLGFTTVAKRQSPWTLTTPLGVVAAGPRLAKLALIASSRRSSGARLTR